MKEKLIIIGSGLAGLAAALAAAEQGQSSVLVSELPPERSQSVLAEGGINGELSGKTEDVLPHWADTVQAGAGLSDPNAVRGMVEAARQRSSAREWSLGIWSLFSTIPPRFRFRGKIC